MGAWRSVRAAGVRIVATGPGSRRRARMLRTTSAEWTPPARASAQAVSTATRPSVSTAERILTIWRSPSSEPFSMPHALQAGRQQPSLEGGSVAQCAGLSGEHRHVMPGIVNCRAAAKAAPMFADDRAVLADHDAIGIGLDLNRPPHG